MFVCIPVPLTKDAQGRHPSDQAIQNAMRSLGFEINYETEADGSEKKKVTIRNDDGTTVDVLPGSTMHYRDIAKRELNEAPRDILLEAKKFCIYAGASSRFRANIIINRVNSGEASIWLFQESLDSLLPFAQHIMNNASEKSIKSAFEFDQLKKQDWPLQLRSGKGGIMISRGSLGIGKVSTLWSNQFVDIIALIIAFVLFVITFITDLIPLTPVDGPNGGHTLVDPLPYSVRFFVDNAWPAAGLASITLLLTLIAASLFIPHSKITWSWRR